MQSDNKPPLVAVGVVHFGSLDETRASLRSVRQLAYPNLVCVLVHNGTAPQSLPLREDFPDIVHEIAAANGGYAAGVNLIARAAARLGAKYVYALNNDIELAPDALDALVRTLEADATIGVATGVHYYADRRNVIQNSGSYIAWRTGAVRTRFEGEVDAGQLAELDEPDFVCGAGMFFPVAVFQSVGPMDESFFLYCEESDWCFRVRDSGRRVVRVAGSRLYHDGGRTVGKTRGIYQYYATRNKVWLAQRWAPLVDRLIYGGRSFLYAYPKMLTGLLARRDLVGFRMTLRGIMHGWFRGAARPTGPIPVAQGHEGIPSQRAGISG